MTTSELKTIVAFYKANKLCILNPLYNVAQMLLAGKHPSESEPLINYAERLYQELSPFERREIEQWI